MPLRLVRSASSDVLWSTCAERLLDALEGRPGPDHHAAWLWVGHRSRRDDLFRRARERGLPGWLAPPVSFFSELPGLFGIRERPVGILTGRLLVARTAAEQGREVGIGTPGHDRGPARAHMLDAVFSELLPEGVTPEELERALEALGGDGFARKRNAWVARTYAAFLRELGRRDLYDPRAVHARVAARVEEGGLRRALAGARALHVYGPTSLRSRLRLFRSLAEQGEVTVSVYLPFEEERSEWEEQLPVEEVEVLDPGDRERAVAVQPAPDALREAAWVARRVKGLVAERGVEPRRIAVVARSGREDTGRIHRALDAVGVPATARLRTPLDEVPALRALLLLFRGEADGWDYRALREVATSHYLGVKLDPRPLDFLARRRRIEGLEAWGEALVELARAAGVAPSARGKGDAEEEEEEDGRDEPEDAWKLRREGVYADRLEEGLEGFAALRERVRPLGEPRPEEGWIRLTLGLLAGEDFDLRRRVCRAPGGRQGVVRLDQRGVRTLETLLREWRELVTSERPLDAAEWHGRLRRLLEANEIALSTPLRTGVQVLEAHEASLSPYRHVFVVHANDGVFPRPPARTGAFSEDERRRLRDLGLPLSSREVMLRRERALWRSVTQVDRVTITYRTTDTRGVPRLPSLMVPDHDPSTELPRTLDLISEPIEAGAAARKAGAGAAAGGPAAPGAAAAGGVPEWAAGPDEHRRREVQRLARLRRGGDTEPFRTPDPARLRHAVLSAFAEEARRREPAALRPHGWNGALRDPLVLEVLADRFDDEYVWSASQLQSYGTRPFDFFLDRVLRLRELEEAEEETSPLEFGALAHDILERFYGALLERGAADGGGLPPGLDGEAADLFERVAEEACRAAEADAGRWLGVPALWAVQREEIVQKVRDFLEKELPHLGRKGERPVALELSFGGRRDEAASPPVVVEGRDAWGREARLRLRGRIDRIDRRGAGDDGTLKVIDYKSGGYPTKYDDGATLQTGLYMKAVELLGRGAPGEAVFRSIKKRTMDGGRLKRNELESVLSFALSVPGRVRAGLFEAVQAATCSLVPWQPGIEVTRTEARLAEGSRYDEPPRPVAAPEAVVAGAAGDGDADG